MAMQTNNGVPKTSATKLPTISMLLFAIPAHPVGPECTVISFWGGGVLSLLEGCVSIRSSPEGVARCSVAGDCGLIALPFAFIRDKYSWRLFAFIVRTR